MMNKLGVQAVKLTNSKIYETEQEWLETFAKNYLDLIIEKVVEVKQLSDSETDELKRALEKWTKTR